MKHSIIASLCLAAAAWFGAAQPAEACGGCENYSYNHYIFHVTPYNCADAYTHALQKAMADDWSKLTGTNVTVKDMEEMSHFTAEDLQRTDHPITRYAQQNRASGVGTYLGLLVNYLELANMTDNPWDYPDETDLYNIREQYAGLISQVRGAASSKLAERYRLLEMRLLYRMGQYASCVSLWKKSGLKHPTNVFDRMTYGFYAGALFRQGRKAEAATVYAELGDAISARFCLNSQCSTESLRSVVKADVNSSVLPVMLENYINSVQETHDCLMSDDAHAVLTDIGPEWTLRETWSLGYITAPSSYARYTTDFLPALRETPMADKEDWLDYFRMASMYATMASDIEDFLSFSAEVLKNRNLKDRMLWASARAYVFYMRGQHAEAWSEIKGLKSMDAASESVETNARIIRLLVATTLPDQAEMEREVKPELEWLASKVQKTRKVYERTYDDEENYQLYTRLYNAFNRIMVHGLAARYQRLGLRGQEYLAYYIANLSPVTTFLEGHRKFYQEQGLFYETYAHLSYDEQCAVYDYLFGGQQLSAFEEYLRSLVSFDRYDFVDFLGTRCMLDGRWEDAIGWLEQLPIDYLQTQSIAPLAYKKDYKGEQWFKHIVISEEHIRNFRLKHNAKLDFCRDVVSTRSQMNLLTGEARCRKAYELATMLFQASHRGDCWWLTHYNNTYDYTHIQWVPAFEPVTGIDFIAEADRLISEETLRTTDLKLRSQALMARFYMAGEPPIVWGFSEEEDDYCYMPDTHKDSYPAFLDLRTMLRGKPGFDDRINNCDVVIHAMELLK